MRSSKNKRRVSALDGVKEKGSRNSTSNKNTGSRNVKSETNMPLKLNEKNRINATAKVDSGMTRKIESKENVRKSHSQPSSPVPTDEHAKSVPSVEPKKIERSRSFFLTRKISKLYNSLTGSRDSLAGSKDCLADISEKDEIPNSYKFTRSLSMIQIPLRKSYRKPMRSSILEQLSEESVSEKGTHKDDAAIDSDLQKDYSSTKAPKPQKIVRKNSSILASLKQTFTSQLEKKRPLNPRWSASLANLQQIDVMVSYEDLSFINYDKFNTYEKNLERTLSQQNLSRKSIVRQSMNEKMLTNQIKRFQAENVTTELEPSTEEGIIYQKSNVVRRRKKVVTEPTDSEIMGTTHWDSNYDQSRNLYRQSLDDKKLKFLNKVNRDSFRFSSYLGQHNTEDVLMLDHVTTVDGQNVRENVLVNKNDSCGNVSSATCDVINEKEVQSDCVDSVTIACSDELKQWNFSQKYYSLQSISEKKSINDLLKSKSLTHLDALESHITTQTAEPPTAKSKADFLDVQDNSGNSTICCLSTSPTTSTAPLIKKKSPSLKCSKRPVLTRSEVSSSEYFCVYYDVENGFSEKEEFIPAIKGTTLADALCTALARRNLSFSQITISDNNFQSSMDLGTPPYSGGVNQNTDVGNLAGKFLIVTEKETASSGAIRSQSGNAKKSSHCNLQKAASFGARQRPAKLFQSASTEETSEISETKTTSNSTSSKQPKQRWSVLFGLKNPQQNQLCETLNQYARNGVPQSQSTYTFEHIDLQSALEYLQNIHSSWMEFVCCPDMTDNEIKIQTAIWELVTTEVDYIHALKTVTDLFLACLEAIQAEHILNEVDQHKLFANIRDICEANIKFWTMYLYPMVRHSINTGHTMCVDYIQPGFLTFATTFAPYKKYCAEQSTCQFYCKELQRNNPLFQAYLAWCEAQKLCNRLRLADILVRPMQRLTKYNLLLSAIKRHITDENDAEIMDAMIHSVENFVCSVNSHLTTRQENERLKGIMARIESYDVVDSNNEHLDKIAKQYSTMFDLCGPMKGCATSQGRHLFMEGDLKFKDNINKVDVHCFLLTDILLVCKTIAKKGLGTLKVIRQPFITDRLVIKLKENALFVVYLNEFNVAVTAFTLQCPEAKSWHDAITKAKHIYSRLKQGSSWDGYNIKHGSSNEMLGVRKSPLNSSIGSRVSSLNNSHSGSVELTESKTVSIDNEKTNSLSSDEGLQMGAIPKKVPQNSPTKFKAMSSNTLAVQPLLSLGQSLPNLNLNSTHISNNTLLVPGAASTSGHTNLLSPSHRGISYPPPSPTRATLRRGFAFSSSIKNPPLVKSRNITSQNSFSIPLPPTTTSSTSSIQQQTQIQSSNTIQSGQQWAQQQQQQQQQQHQQQQPQQLQHQLNVDVSSMERNIQTSHESDV